MLTYGERRWLLRIRVISPGKLWKFKDPQDSDQHLQTGSKTGEEEPSEEMVSLSVRLGDAAF